MSASVRRLSPWLCAAVLAAVPVARAGGAPAAAPRACARPARAYDLGGERSSAPQYYRLETRIVSYAEDGTRTLDRVDRLWLSCTPVAGPDGAGERCVCRKFTVQAGAGPERRVPALDGWSHTFWPTDTGLDEQGRVFGIEHGRFERLADETGQPLDVNTAYGAYNAFVDFHTICDHFAAATRHGRGIQDLTAPGQTIVHASAFSEPPVDLGTLIAKGSRFRNGEVTLEFKGVGSVEGDACAVVGFDSGAGSFEMLMHPAPNVEIRTVGASHYRGDLYLDLASRRVRRATLGEIVVAKVTMGGQRVANSVVERTLTLRSLGREEFEKD